MENTYTDYCIKSVSEDYCIESVSEFLEIIKQLSNNDEKLFTQKMLFRGESKDYHGKNPKFISSAFRSAPIAGFETSGKLPFKENVDSFKYEVYSEVDNDIKNNFLAYAQHHGIKTNLIDVTSNPLIALYFSAESALDEEGYVYILNLPIIDITDVFDYNDEDNLFGIINSNNENTVQKLVKKFHGFGSENMDYIENYFFTLFQHYYREVYEDNDFTINENGTEKLITDVIDKIVLNDPSNYIKDSFEGYDSTWQKGFFYYILLRGFIRLKNKTIQGDNRLNGVIPMIYKPAMGFKRGINQSGLFLYQNYIISKGNALLSWQDIVPVQTIKVKNKQSILKELDVVNINKKFIYGDHSSIAKYIEEQHEDKKKIMGKISDELFTNL